ncbi:MAG: Gx transporter family protein [Coriobacteriia bacterium]|nr:Gx transporter family protein [Coriobacteriia bacterium]
MRSSAEVSPRLRTVSTVASRRVALGGMLLVCAVALGLIESWLLAWSPVPWLRLGLANIAVVVALSCIGPRSAFTVSLLRVALVGVAAGTLFGPGTLLAVSGAVCAFGAMVAVRAAGPRFSVVGWSIAGASAHVVGQFVAAAVVTGSPALLSLVPLSVLASLFLGVATGLIARPLISRVMSAA